MRSIAKTLKRLGAEYAKFGDDFAQALEYARTDDVNWFLSRVNVPSKLLTTMPAACKRLRCDTPHVKLYVLKKKKEIVATLWAARSLRERLS